VNNIFNQKYFKTILMIILLTKVAYSGINRPSFAIGVGAPFKLRRPEYVASEELTIDVATRGVAVR
jgi:hypothetical protein